MKSLLPYFMPAVEGNSEEVCWYAVKGYAEQRQQICEGYYATWRLTVPFSQYVRELLYEVS